MHRRAFTERAGALCAAAALGLPQRASAARADGPLVVVVPFGPGGTTDLLGRLVANHLAAALGRTVVVENRPGAATAIGAAHVARATPDGNTLLIATSATLAINPLLYPKLSYEPRRDFAPIGMIASVPLVLLVAPALGVRSVGVVALGVTSRRRQPTPPGVVCIAEAGVAELAGFEAVGWQALVAPARTPVDVLDRLRPLLVQWIERPEVRERLQREGLEPRSGTPEELTATTRHDADRWARIIKAARIPAG